MNKFKIYANATNPYEVALVNLTSNSLVFRCNGGENAEKIEGFFAGLRYCNYDYIMTDIQKLTPDNNLFLVYGFTNCNAGFSIL
jgi:hypothetical protein